MSLTKSAIIGHFELFLADYQKAGFIDVKLFVYTSKTLCKPF